jgi:putative spermidine/putrescine transport system permease protein
MIGGEGQRAGLGSIGLVLLAALVLVLLIAPIVIVAIVSFGSAESLSFPPPGFSLRWYRRLASLPAWRQSLWVSVQVATITMVLATGLGLMASLALVRSRFRGKGLVYALLLSPMIVPTIITAVALYFFLARIGGTGSILAMAVGHTVLALPIVVIVITSTLQGFDSRLELAAFSLGASRFTTFRRITVPLIAPAVFSAALFAFLTSFDELLIPLFLAGVEAETLSVRIWNSLLLEVDPMIAAVSTFFVVVTMAVLGASALLRRT